MALCQRLAPCRDKWQVHPVWVTDQRKSAELCKVLVKRRNGPVWRQTFHLGWDSTREQLVGFARVEAFQILFPLQEEDWLAVARSECKIFTGFWKHGHFCGFPIFWKVPLCNAAIVNSRKLPTMTGRAHLRTGGPIWSGPNALRLRKHLIVVETSSTVQGVSVLALSSISSSFAACVVLLTHFSSSLSTKNSVFAWSEKRYVCLHSEVSWPRMVVTVLSTDLSAFWSLKVPESDRNRFLSSAFPTPLCGGLRPPFSGVFRNPAVVS